MDRHKTTKQDFCFYPGFNFLNIVCGLSRLRVLFFLYSSYLFFCFSREILTFWSIHFFKILFISFLVEAYSGLEALVRLLSSSLNPEPRLRALIAHTQRFVLIPAASAMHFCCQLFTPRGHEKQLMLRHYQHWLLAVIIELSNTSSIKLLLFYLFLKVVIDYFYYYFIFSFLSELLYFALFAALFKDSTHIAT